MTEPIDSELVALATPYALDALTEAERADIERQIAAAPPDVAQAFADEVRAVHETMAVMSAATAVEPPEDLRSRVLAGVNEPPLRTLRQPRRWVRPVLAAAAALVIGLGSLGVGLALRPPVVPTTAEQVFAAPDVQTVSGQIPGGGTATVVFSREQDAGVLVMNDVPSPQPGTVYQMWLVDAQGAHSAGTMDAQAVAGPSTTAVLPDLGTSTALAFTVEPPGGSQQPTATPFAELPLT